MAVQAIHTRYGPQYGHVPGRQAHEVVFILRRIVEQANEWRIPIFVMDCDVAAASDHVSHHLIFDAMEALNVPPVLVAAWIGKYWSSETHIRLDDILTLGIRRTRSVPQGDPCTANLFGAALDVLATAFCEKVPGREVGAARRWQIRGATAFCRQLRWTANCVERVCVVYISTRLPGCKY